MDFLVIAKSGRFFATMVCAAETTEKAEKELSGIIEAGGNIWEDTPDGFIPEEEETYQYEISSVVDVTGLPKEAVETLTLHLVSVGKLVNVAEVMVS